MSITHAVSNGPAGIGRFAVFLTCLAFALVAAVPAARGSQKEQPTASKPAGVMMTVRGKRLYVEDTGPRDAPILLYVHGGPGAGSYDFRKLQGERLSKRLRVITFDQRGVLRSDAVTADEPFGVRELVEDIEALRAALGVRSWSVLGHSFGGLVVLRYVLTYPGPVERALFECPTFDLETSSRSMLRAAARELDALGKTARAAELRAIAAHGTAREAFDAFGSASGDLGDRRDYLYVHGPDKKFFDKIVAASGLPSEYWGKTGGPFTEKLFNDPVFHENLLPRLGEIKAPALLMVGRYDSVCAPEQVAAFRKQVRLGRVEVFEKSAHFIRFEEPDRYAQTVTAFMLGKKPAGVGSAAQPGCRRGMRISAGRTSTC